MRYRNGRGKSGPIFLPDTSGECLIVIPERILPDAFATTDWQWICVSYWCRCFTPLLDGVRDGCRLAASRTAVDVGFVTTGNTVATGHVATGYIAAGYVTNEYVTAVATTRELYPVGAITTESHLNAYVALFFGLLILDALLCSDE